MYHIKFSYPNLPHGRIGVGDLANLLEKKYQLISQFVEMHKKEILKEALEAIVRNAFKPVDFVDLPKSFYLWTVYINQEEHGITTRASVKVRSARLKKNKERKKKRPVVARTPFVDTGIYRNTLLIHLVKS